MGDLVDENQFVYGGSRVRALRFLAWCSKSSTTPRRINEDDDDRMGTRRVEWEDGDSDEGEGEEEEVDGYKSNDDELYVP